MFTNPDTWPGICLDDTPAGWVIHTKIEDHEFIVSTGLKNVTDRLEEEVYEYEKQLRTIVENHLGYLYLCDERKFNCNKSDCEVCKNLIK